MRNYASDFLAQKMRSGSSALRRASEDAYAYFKHRCNTDICFRLIPCYSPQKRVSFNGYIFTCLNEFSSDKIKLIFVAEQEYL